LVKTADFPKPGEATAISQVHAKMARIGRRLPGRTHGSNEQRHIITCRHSILAAIMTNVVGSSLRPEHNLNTTYIMTEKRIF